MEIKNKKGKYTIKVEVERNLVFETIIGYWKTEDVERLHKDYVEKVVPLFKGKQWAKCCDLRKYRASMITQEIKEHAKWGSENGYIACAIITDVSDVYKSVIELQMKTAVKDIPFKLNFFTTIEEADEWLKSEGF